MNTCEVERRVFASGEVVACGVPLTDPALVLVGVCASCLLAWDNPYSEITHRGMDQVERARTIYDGPGVFAVYDLVASNGRTWRQNNLDKAHKYALGDVVEVSLALQSDDTLVQVDLRGTCRLYVVMLTRDCDGTPLYGLSDLPVVWPHDEDRPVPMFDHEKLLYRTMARVFEHGFNEASLHPTGLKAEKMYADVREYLSR